MLRKASGLVRELVIHPERALENLEVHSYGLVYSQSVLLALIDSGMSRDDAYRIVQEAARTASESRTPFRVVIERDPSVNLSMDVLDRAFDATRLLAHRGRFLEALYWNGQ
jgi:adenylosuccinate lyase